jgi:hypothetical protein
VHVKLWVHCIVCQKHFILKSKHKKGAALAAKLVTEQSTHPNTYEKFQTRCKLFIKIWLLKNSKNFFLTIELKLRKEKKKTCFFSSYEKIFLLTISTESEEPISGLPDFSWSKHTKMEKNIPNDHKLFQPTVNYTKWP